MINNVIDSISEIETITNESTVDTLISMSTSYDKMSMIMESCPYDELDKFSLFSHEDYIVQEGIGDELKKMNEGKGILNKIIWFIPRLIAAIFKTLKTKLSKSSELSVSIEKQCKEDSSIKAKISKLWGKYKNSTVATTVTAAAGYAAFLKFVAFPLVDKQYDSAYENYFAKKNKRNEWIDTYDDFKKRCANEKYFDSYVESKMKNSKLGSEDLDRAYAELSYYTETIPILQKVYNMAKEFADDKENHKIIMKFDGKNWYKKLNKHIEDWQNECNKLRDFLKKNNIDISSIYADEKSTSKATPSGSKSVNDTIDKSFKDLQKKCKNTINPNDIAKYPDQRIRNFMTEWKRKNDDLLNYGLLGYDEKTGQIFSEVNLDIFMKKYVEKLEALDRTLKIFLDKYDPHGMKQTKEDSELIVQFDAVLDQFGKDMDDVLKELYTKPNKNTDVNTFLKNITSIIGSSFQNPSEKKEANKKSVTQVVDNIVKRISDDLYNKVTKWKLTTVAKHSTEKEKVDKKVKSDIDRIMAQKFNAVNQSIINFAYSILETTSVGLEMMNAACKSTNGINYTELDENEVNTNYNNAVSSITDKNKKDGYNILNRRKQNPYVEPNVETN